MAAESLNRRRESNLQCCQRRLEYLSNRLQDLAFEIGDGQGAVWLKDNMWFLNKSAMYFDDVLYSVGKISNHLVSYLTFHKQRLASIFPFMSYMGILYEVGEILGIVRDMFLTNPLESLSLKQSQIDLFWTDCTPFLFVFESSNHLLLNREQIPAYMRAIMDLVPTVIQVGLCMYSLHQSHLRGFDCFAETCIRLSKALVEGGEFLDNAETLEPVIVPFLRQWILFALELVQNGVKARTDMCLSPKVSQYFNEAKKDNRRYLNKDSEETTPKSKTTLSISSSSSLPDEVAESTLAPLKINNSCQVRTSCQPFRWIDAANIKLVHCPNENRKMYLEEIVLRENQKIISDIFLVTGKQPRSWKGIKLHCPLTKSFDDTKIKLIIKVKISDVWHCREAHYEQFFGKGNFLTFDGCEMEGFVAIEDRPLTCKEIDEHGGSISTSFDSQIEAVVPRGAMSQSNTVKLMVQPTNRSIEQQYRNSCPEDFQHIKSTSHAIEIEGANVTSDKSIAITIPFNVLKDRNTKIIVLKYNGDKFEVCDSEGVVEHTTNNCYTVNSSDGGTVLATVDNTTMTQSTQMQIRNEMEVLLGKKQLCKILIFVENQRANNISQVNLNQIVLCIVCTEKYRLEEIIEDKHKIGLSELPNSQSPDRLMQQTDEITIEVKGSVTLDPDIPDDTYTITYLEGSDNFARFPVKITNCEGKITFIMRSGKDKSNLHTYFCNIHDLLAIIVQGYTTPSPNSIGSDEVFHYEDSGTAKKDDGQEKETEVIKDVKLKEVMKERKHPQLGFQRMSSSSDIIQGESSANSDDQNMASLKILNRNSLVIIAKQIRNDESHLLGVCLGLKSERLSQIYSMYRHSNSLATFYVLYEWRGRRTQAELADKLFQALTDIGRRDLASVLKEVRRQNRELTAEDFKATSSRRRSAKIKH